jgi:hypothetical protein
MKVTYLLGAGASAQCLPTYSNFSERFKEFANFIRGKRDEANEKINTLLPEIVQLIDIIEKEFVFHNTPDLIAKKYFHKHSKEKLYIIKKVLILYFLYEQATNRQLYDLDNATVIKDIIDKRYDAFLASLLKPIPQIIELQENFNVLTWNYDLQLEISFSTYLERQIPFIQDFVQSYPKIQDNRVLFDKSKFSIIHLNGIAYARPEKVKQSLDNVGLFAQQDLPFAIYLSDVYDAMLTSNPSHPIGGENLLTFAWENINKDFSLKESDVLEKAMTIAEDTEILIIIGYSFPIFNRVIDKNLFSKMHKLRTIYIQSPQANEIKNILVNDLVQTTGEYLEVNYENIGYWNQFYIPHEWNSKSRNSGPSII